MKRNSSSKFFDFTERQWDSSEQDSSAEPLAKPVFRRVVKRLFSGTLQLPRLSCRQSLQQRPEEELEVASTPSIKASRSLGTLTSCVPEALSCYIKSRDISLRIQRETDWT
ncbi:hypothetical protein LDENG_00141270 [Lucifuga dentata]|nr:hypothetical protein LDENG_00141270 [Lucifuga dentata]